MSRTDLCETCGKPIGKAGSMTQWIFDPSKCSCGAPEGKQKEPSNACALCGNPFGRTEGSITQWIFRGRVCTCLATDQQIVSGDGISLPPNDAIAGDRYHFVGIAGQGGAGTVFKAKDTKLGRFVSIKVISTGGAEDSKVAEHFEREARAASKLQHPNIVTVQDFGTMSDGRLFLVAEWIDGITLAQYLSRHGTLSIDAATEVFSEVLDALSHAHNRNVVHRDIKPNNIMLGRTDNGAWTIKVIDFGTAREVDENLSETTVENIACSPFYMSPEQAGGNVDQRSDLYSVGCSVFEALVGKPPFTGQPLSVVMRHQTEPPPHLSVAAGTEFPDYIEQFVEKALAKQPEDRFQTSDEMKSVLLERRAEKSIAKKPKNSLALIAITGAIGLVIIGCATLLFFQQKGDKPAETFTIRKPLPFEEKTWDYGGTSGRYYVSYDDSSIRRFELSVKGIRNIAKYKVTRLDIPDGEVNDQLLKEIPRLKHLISLNINRDQVTDQGLIAAIPQMPELLVLRAQNNQISDEGLKILSTANKLKVIDLANCKISASAFDKIASFPPELSILGLSGTGVNDHTVERIVKFCPNLTQLEVSRTKVGDASIPQILKLKRLKTLFLSHTQVTDAGARQLEKLKTLIALSLETKGVDKATLQYLDHKLPTCRILNADEIAETDF